MVLKDVRPIIAELVRLKKSIPLEIDAGRYFSGIRKNTHGEAIRGGIKKALRAIEQAPTIDAEPVRHGEWLKFVYDTRWVKCSECHCNWERRIVEECNMAYCPNCGAEMDGGKKDENRFHSQT